MSELLALLERRRREMTVVIMKASERQASIRDGDSHFYLSYAPRRVRV
jgi:hypothetical protein